LGVTRREYLLMERLLRHASTVVQRVDLLA
jgi:DNA-binding response OmpR family regulator